MDVKCSVCGTLERVEKWQDTYEKLREEALEAYICERCQARIRHDAQKETR